jgi:hypothetical protein
LNFNLTTNLQSFKLNSLLKLNIDSLLTNTSNNLLINLSNKNFNEFLMTEGNNINFYENDKLEEVEETLENLRVKTNNFPIKLIKGVLNKHNISLLTSNKSLNKNIIFSYRINNDQIVEKISQVEQF